MACTQSWAGWQVCFRPIPAFRYTMRCRSAAIKFMSSYSRGANATPIAQVTKIECEEMPRNVRSPTSRIGRRRVKADGSREAADRSERAGPVTVVARRSVRVRQNVSQSLAPRSKLPRLPRPVAAGAGVSIVEPVTARHFAELGRCVVRPLSPAQPFRYDLLLPATRQPSRVAGQFLRLVNARFEAFPRTQF